MKRAIRLSLLVLLCFGALRADPTQQQYDDQEKIRRYLENEQKKDEEQREAAKERYDHPNSTQPTPLSPQEKQEQGAGVIVMLCLMAGAIIWMLSANRRASKEREEAVLNSDRLFNSVREKRGDKEFYEKRLSELEKRDAPKSSGSSYHQEMLVLAQKERSEKVQRTGTDLVQIINETAERTGQSPAKLAESVKSITQVPFSFTDGKLNITVEQLEEIGHKMVTVKKYCESL